MNLTPLQLACSADGANLTTTERRRLILFPIVSAFLLALAAPQLLAQEVDTHNPIGVTGIFNGNVGTGGSYDPLSHSAQREITDLVVPGSIGKYPLKMTRHYNSRHPLSGAMGPGWSFEYYWAVSSDGSKLTYPNGNVLDKWCQQPVGVSDRWQTLTCYQTGCDGDFRLADGGTVHFVNGRVTSIDDPYGQTTTITYAVDLSWMKVMEPGGRYLLFTYGGPSGRLSRVEAHGLGTATVTDWVNYSYTSTSPGGNGASLQCLTGVAYSDGTSASYTYVQDNVQTQYKVLPLLSTANDVRYNGPMRQIAYDYQGSPTPHGAITAERFSAGGTLVSSISPGATSCTTFDCSMETDFTETRGDGPSRTFHYTDLTYHSVPGEPGCPEVQYPDPPSQFLLSYTDFQNQNHTTQLGYDANWYVNSVTDANNHTTHYTRGGIGEITQIKHPDNTHIDYTYYDESPNISGHYLKQITNERGSITYHYRDAQHRIYRTDYRDASNNVIAFDAFAYNNFGQVTIHQLKNGTYEYYQYDGRGLLIKRWNPTTTVAYPPSDSLPHTTYTYYTSVPWTDRVQTITLPANVSGNAASDTYEYDRALDANGITNLNGAAVAGRGLVTKITHADIPSNTYQQFKYDAYGNKRWEDNELRKPTSYSYDEYNRLLTVTNPLNKTTTYTYNPTNGTGNRLSHTTNNPDTVTTPANIQTINDYDENFRKTSTKVGSSTTSFDYDSVGNQTWVTDPNIHKTYNTYDNRNRKTSAVEAWGTNLATTTVWHYDGASNINKIDRPDGTSETKGYDALNRMLWNVVPQSDSVSLTTTYVYNPSGTLQWVMDPKAQITHFSYNESDEKITMTYPNNTGTQLWTYDNANNLASRTTVGGETQSFTYDIRNRKTGMSWNGGGGDWASFTYYDDSRLHTAQNANSTVTRAYDDAGRLTLDQQNVTDLGTKSVNYPSYDNDGRLTHITGDSYDYTFGYDAMGRFETITGGSLAFQYYYDAASNEIKRHNYLTNPQLEELYGRDSLNRMYVRYVLKGGTAFSGEIYEYDRMSRLNEVDRAEDVKKDAFFYYANGELMWGEYGMPMDGPFQEGDPDTDTTSNVDPWAGYQPPDTAEPEPTPPPGNVPGPAATPSNFDQQETANMSRWAVYSMDQAGNRTLVTDTGVNISYTPNPLNQYTGTVGGAAITNGNEHEIKTFQGNTYTYINDEHLKQVTNGSTNYYLYYDALGRCVKRILNGTTTYYIYDGEKPILEYKSSDLTHPAKNLYGKGIDEILMRTDPTVNSGQPFYYQQDHEGSVTHVVNAAGTVLESYRYDAFGAPTFYNGGVQIASTAYNNRFLFTGREYAATYQKTYVSAFTFYEYRARAYHPGLGRFMSEDPKGFAAGDYNLFRYCHNDPLDLTDPMGLSEATGLLQMGTHDRVWDDREYNKAMADAQWRGSDLMHGVSGAIGIGTAGYQTYGFQIAWSALKAGATYGYKGIQSDRLQGKEGNDLREYNGNAEGDKDGTFHITGPNKGDQAKYVPPSGSRKESELGYSSTIDCGPNCAGIYYAHPRPGDLIHNHPADRQAIEGAHHGAGVLGVTAAPQRGDATGRGRPIFEGYDGSTHKFYGNSFFNQFPDFY